MKDNYYSNIIVNKSNEKIISEIEEFSENAIPLFMYYQNHWEIMPYNMIIKI